MDTQPQTTVFEKPRRTRAEVMRDRVKIRLATNEAGPLISEILKENNVDLPGADWNTVFPNWLIATVKDEVIGCVMVMPAKPIGFCECLFVKPSAPFKMRAIAIRKLMLQGMATIYQSGASYIACNVDFGNDKFVDVIEKFNPVRISERTLFVKRLRD